MYIYNGKMNWFNYAVNENFTIVMPSGFAVNAPICTFWQWTVDAKGKEKANTVTTGHINSAYHLGGEHKIGFFLDQYYTFEAQILDNGNKLVVTMSNNKGIASAPMTLTRSFANDSLSSAAQIYAGKLDWFQYAVNEMITVVLPSGIYSGATSCIFFQWTVDSSGNKKGNKAIVTPLNGASITESGTASASTNDGYYTYTFEVPKIGDVLTLNMQNPKNEHDHSAPYKLARVMY